MTSIKYFEHILHGQIEPELFWRNEMLNWETDEAGNTPEEQFELILAPASEEDYFLQQAAIQADRGY